MKGQKNTKEIVIYQSQSNVQKMHIANSDKPVDFYSLHATPPESVIAIFATTAIGS